jgi:hypothetical protein
MLRLACKFDGFSTLTSKGTTTDEGRLATWPVYVLMCLKIAAAGTASETRPAFVLRAASRELSCQVDKNLPPSGTRSAHKCLAFLLLYRILLFFQRLDSRCTWA